MDVYYAGTTMGLEYTKSSIEQLRRGAATLTLLTQRKLIETEEECLAYQAKALNKVQKDGLRKDTIFQQELAGLNTDNRLGVSLIARVPSFVSNHIRDIQEEIAEIEPSVLSYPNRALHLTLQPLGFNLSEAKMNRVLDRSKAILSSITPEHRAVCLRPLALIVDQDGFALHLTPTDDSLLRLRKTFTDLLEAEGISPEYKPSAHISIARAVKPCHGSTQLLNLAQSYLPPSWNWTIELSDLVAGKTRYGLPERLEKQASFALASTQSLLEKSA
jgi:2'-5' RNA ligase